MKLLNLHPSALAEHLPIIPPPSGTANLLEELGKKHTMEDIIPDWNAEKEIEEAIYAPTPSDTETIRPEVKASFERLDQWILKHADILNEDEEEFEDEEDEE